MQTGMDHDDIIHNANDRLSAKPSGMGRVNCFVTGQIPKVVIPQHWLRIEIHQPRQDTRTIRPFPDQVANRV
jgi:hypothetical protein